MKKYGHNFYVTTHATIMICTIINYEKKIRSKYKNNISSVIITHVNEFIVKVVVNYAIIKKTKQKITNLPHQD